MASATEISQRALKRLGIGSSGNPASAADVADATEALSAMIASWEADGLSGDTLPLDPRFEQAIIAMLAVRIAEDFGQTAGPILLRDAKSGWAGIQAAFFSVPMQTFDPAIVGGRTNTVLTSTGAIPDGYRLWAANTAYTLRQTVVNNANLYEVSTPGNSAASGGPTGTGNAIVDGSVVWVWRRVTAQ